MDLYGETAQAASKVLIKKYSTSFSAATRLFPKDIRQHIYNIYGLVRIADEIVDTYRGKNTVELLDKLEEETYQALKTQYSTNLIIHAFCLTAQRFFIGPELLKPFFESMRQDTYKKSFTTSEYRQYIHGSAEVVGLMCLKVFSHGDLKMYDRLKSGAASLGAAYQKVNFLRDVADDYNQLERFYFPATTMDELDEKEKINIIRDIQHDFNRALPAINKLPKAYRPAVKASYRYYYELLKKIEKTPIKELKRRRVRIPNYRKLLLLSTTAAKESFSK